MVVEKDKVITIDYTLKDSDGQTIDSSEESEPLVYLHGNDNLIPGLEKQLEGKKEGDKLSCVVHPGEAYGEYDENLVFTVKKSSFADPSKIEEGMQFEAHGEDGARVVTVVAVKGDDVTVDANHPLAGEDLHFDVKVVGIREATAEELAHGHVHSHDECDDDCDCGEEGGCGCGCCG
ncbi:MAG: peptidylprolyl isomerase [Treponema sp.]|nr:peptidylprolyl isomerase [Treponema sp.]